MSNPFDVTRRDIVYEGRVFTIIRDEVRHPDGYSSVREVVRHDGGAVVVPVYENGDVLLIRQFRYPLEEDILELPAGKLSPGEDPHDCAIRELKEETGCTAASMDKLMAMLTTPGFCTETLHLYLAEGLTDGEQELEEGEESITVLRVPMVEALDMCRDGRIRDGKTVTALMLASMKLGILTHRASG
ncbi:MAG: NUDIX hydrolase [Ignavibacteria bacterium]|nr:MAG: NUDIX hydrolase [Ignavibacteria bacterium]